MRYAVIIQRSRDIWERMIDMMETLKWKVIELLIRFRVLAVARVRTDGRSRR